MSVEVFGRIHELFDECRELLQTGRIPAHDQRRLVVDMGEGDRLSQAGYQRVAVVIDGNVADGQAPLVSNVAHGQASRPDTAVRRSSQPFRS